MPPSTAATPARPSLGGRLSVYALTLLGLIGGWLILLMGGFHSQVGRWPLRTVWVDGPMAWVMMGIAFSMTAIGVAAILQMHQAPVRWQWAGALITLALPLLWVLSAA